MRLRRAKIVTETLLAVLGVGSLIIAFFAYQLRLDHNRIMGPGRTILAVFGGGCLLMAVWIASSSWRRRPWPGLGQYPFFLAIGRAAGWIGRPFARIRQAGQRIAASPPLGFIQRHPGLWAVAGAALVILVSWWYITSGILFTWVSYSAYFNRQANAFLAGQLDLLEKPPAALLALAQPYAWENRATVGGYLWDASLYKGKYYLYWGPVPALLAAAAKLVHPAVVEDQYLLFFFYCGLAIAMAALLHWLRGAFFPRSPAWTVLLFTLVAGISAPVFWLINRPNVYETAIAGGQFFLLLGLLAALRGLAILPFVPALGSLRGEDAENRFLWALCVHKNLFSAKSPPSSGKGVGGWGRNERRKATRWLALAGLAWGLSIGSRLNNIVSIAWMVGLCLLFLLVYARERPGWLGHAACLLLPLALCGAALGWYNYARFGNVLETGHRYQLTGLALPTDYSKVMSPTYVAPNLYNALIRPFVFDGKHFPFIFTPFISQKMWPWYIHLPPVYYYSEPITGIFPTIPAFFLILLPIMKPVRAAWRWVHEAPVQAIQPRHPLYSWSWWMVCGALLCSLGVLLVFISSSMRYLADVVPLAGLLSAICLWWAGDFLQEHPGSRGFILGIAAILGLASILIGLLANFQNGDRRFLANNPELYQAIARFFTGGQ
jgi:hypothetical protein